jgi:predicted class III extradiol MEMO1 family dioxygenase
MDCSVTELQSSHWNLEELVKRSDRETMDILEAYDLSLASRMGPGCRHDLGTGSGRCSVASG